MKKLFVVSKTHLDLGFTDFACKIKKQYIDSFIPGAVNLAAQVNNETEKNFIWTTGSWILKEALLHGTDEQKTSLKNAIKKGNIVPHAMPFTTHTELLDEDTLEYGLSIVDKLDEIRGRKTVAAKLTDVPGHTKGLVKALAAHGIKLLHIGVNGASTLPEVPPCFLWKCEDSEIVVIYSGAYGGAFKCDLVDEILYFDHTLDNHGAPSSKKILNKIGAIKKQYPDYEVTAGSMDDFADVLWEKRALLPVVKNEIGDTWIHGSATDPYKSAALRELMSLKGKWLADGSMLHGSDEYIHFSDALLCVAEHTCGMDNKKFFADYENYLKKDFEAARKRDNVVLRRLLQDFPQNFFTFLKRKSGEYHDGCYSTIEKSWAEQREYITLAVNALDEEHKTEAMSALSRLIPVEPAEIKENLNPYGTFNLGKWSLAINENGGIGKLCFDGDDVIASNNQPAAEYRAYSSEDYAFWVKHYTRDLKKNIGWALGDFSRPLLKYADGKYKTGRFFYHISEACAEQSENSIEVTVNLTCEKSLCEEQGAPILIQLIYHLTENGLKINTGWFGKDANRLTEAIFLHFYPAGKDIVLNKTLSKVNPSEVVSKGGRNLHAVFGAVTKNGRYSFVNRHNPLISIGRGKILEIDNKLENIETDGISYVLYNNVWGTNFPLWYEDNASFEFEITKND